MGTNKPTFAVAGLGNIYPRHKKAIEDVGGEIIGTWDVDKSRGSTVKSFEELVSLPADYVVILTPNKLHLDQARYALNRGKKVIVEKPPVMSYLDLFEFDKDEPIYTVSQLRYLPDFETLELKNVNDVRLNICAHRDPLYLANWRGKLDWSGGLLYIVGIHYFDILTWLFGSLLSIDHVRWIGDWRVQGIIQLDKALVQFNIEISEEKPDFKELIINDKKIDLAKNFFSLHGEVYKDILAGKGIHPQDFNKTLLTLDKIYAKR